MRIGNKYRETKKFNRYFKKLYKKHLNRRKEYYNSKINIMLKF